LVGGRTEWHVDHSGYLVGVCLAVDALTIGARDADAVEFLTAWDGLLSVLRHTIGAEAPYTSAQLLTASALCDDEMMYATDALYFYGRARVEAQPPQALTQVLEEPDATRPSGSGDDYERWILRRSPAAPASAPARARASLPRRARSIRRRWRSATN
jgi:hypothetical protein